MATVGLYFFIQLGPRIHFEAGRGEDTEPLLAEDRASQHSQRSPLLVPQEPPMNLKVPFSRLISLFQTLLLSYRFFYMHENSFTTLLELVTWSFATIFTLRMHNIIEEKSSLLTVTAFAAFLFAMGSFYPAMEDFIWNEFDALSALKAVGASFSIALLCILIPTIASVGEVEAEDAERSPSPELKSGFLSKMSFSWLSPLILKGNKRPLDHDVLWELNDADQSAHVVEKCKKLWLRLVYLVKRPMAWQFFCAFLSGILTFANPFFLNRVLHYIQSESERWTSCYFIIGMFMSMAIKAMVDGQVYFNGRRVGTRMRAALVSDIYQKSLRKVQANAKETKSSEDASMGKIATLMSVDTERIRNYVCYCHNLLLSPLQIIFAISSLIIVLGWPALCGVAVMILMVPITSLVGKWITSLQEKLMSSTDKRVNIMNEVINGIRIIKYFAWEPQFIQKVMKARETELSNLLKMWWAMIVSTTVWHTCPLLVAFLTFFSYTKLAGQVLDVTTAFTGLALLTTLQGPIMTFPFELLDLFQAFVALNRINNFLDQEEIDKYSKDASLYSAADSPGTQQGETLGVRDGTFVYYGATSTLLRNSTPELTQLTSYDSLQESINQQQGFILKGLNVKFPKRGLTVICGPTGAGKSSLVLALLGELQCLGGELYFPSARPLAERRKVAYVGQTAWLMNSTVRENILFGEPYDEMRYQMVVQACALSRDFETLQGGDLTEIGEKGINLSGGQKQRISLARAAYSTARYILLDDPLSAVDAPTAKQLLSQCILGVMKDRTRILVSHAVSLVVPKADHVVLLRSGRVVGQGPPREILTSPQAEKVFGTDAISALNNIFESSAPGTPPEDSFVIEEAGTPREGSKLVQDEAKATGAVQLETYISYIKAAGGYLFITVLLTTTLAVLLMQVLDDWWLKHWSESTSLSQQIFMLAQDRLISVKRILFSGILSDSTEHSTDYYLTIYGLIGLFAIIIEDVNYGIEVFGAYNASKVLHSKLLKTIIGAPMRFFEVTPIGRIINRFSKDIGSIDTSVLRGIVIMCVISVVSPLFLVVAFPIAFVYQNVASRYLTCSRELKRLESVSRSPVYSLFSETLVGVPTIRAYGAEDRFMGFIHKRTDDNHRPFFWLWVSNRWLAFRIDIIAAFVVLGGGLSLLIAQVSAGLAGLCLTYALQFTDALLWTIRMHAHLEMTMNSVERVDEYLEIEQETQVSKSERVEPPDEWPSRGRIKVNGLCVRYSVDQPFVLRNVSFECGPCTKIGVVGRTGAGKSTLSLAFFRILPVLGTIKIDGIDISKLSLKDLRSKLTIIPQDPVLFSGTLRSNLDPFNVHDDPALWASLERVRFLQSMQNKDRSFNSLNENSLTQISLDASVSENGNNFSQGQRQLICMARALLRQSKVVILDEATASVDNETDAQIQKTIREEFADATILTIAHRLRTVMDYDKILVLDKGEVVEYASPWELVQKENGWYRKMCEETGELPELIEIAKRSFLSRR